MDCFAAIDALEDNVKEIERYLQQMHSYIVMTFAVRVAFEVLLVCFLCTYVTSRRRRRIRRVK